MLSKRVFLLMETDGLRNTTHYFAGRANVNSSFRIHLADLRPYER